MDLLSLRCFSTSAALNLRGSSVAIDGKSDRSDHRLDDRSDTRSDPMVIRGILWGDGLALLGVADKREEEEQRGHIIHCFFSTTTTTKCTRRTGGCGRGGGGGGGRIGRRTPDSNTTTTTQSAHTIQITIKVNTTENNSCTWRSSTNPLPASFAIQCSGILETGVYILYPHKRFPSATELQESCFHSAKKF